MTDVDCCSKGWFTYWHKTGLYRSCEWEREGHIDVVAADQGESMMDQEEIISSQSEAEEDDDMGKSSKLDVKKKGWFSSMFQR